MLTRFRAALAHGTVESALRETLTMAGRSVLIAGGTVVLALLGMLLIGVNALLGLAFLDKISNRLDAARW